MILECNANKSIQSHAHIHDFHATVDACAHYTDE
jgi:hypothetical protein